MIKKTKGIPDGIPYEDLIASEEEGSEMIRFYYEHFHVYYDDVKRIIRYTAPRLAKEYVEELHQETILRALEHYKSLRDPNNAKDWMFSIARNLVRTHYRETKEEVDIVIPEHCLELDEAVPDYGMMEDLDFTVKEVIRREQLKLVMECLEKLTEDQKNAIRLHHFGNMTFQEIAKRYGVKKETAYGWYRRGCIRVRRMVKTKGGRWNE